MIDELDSKAVDILKKNDRGGFTIPTAKLYPYQWNWDSAFIALGFATFDSARAWRELELLVEGQYDDGMIPHIIFRHDDPDYFPGPTVWQTPTKKMPASGISQPPVLATIVRQLVDQLNGDALGHAEKLFEAIVKWHRWFHTARKPDCCPAVCTVHPWESGRDNCPDWNIGLSLMQVDPDLEPYQRKDLEHADESQRPSKEEYDKYVTIVKFGRDHDWDQKVFTERGPFLMADPGIHFILLRAVRDLLWLAQRLKRVDVVEEIEQWIDAAEQATDYFWNPQFAAFCARDVHSGTFSNGFSSASALCFYAGVGSEQQRKDKLKHMARIATKTQFGQPSWDSDSSDFESQRYWCGPVWPQMNYMISVGLQEQGYAQQADRIRTDLRALIQQSGFYECFDPLTGHGYIGTNFSWTAALWLAWARPDDARTRAA